MEGLSSPYGVVKHSSSRKVSSASPLRDLWLIAREGSLSELDSALLLLKKHGGNIDSRNACGLTPLHIATWRNHVPIVKRLLAAGADPDARDGESGWSSLHRALHFGHLAVASILIQSGASLTIEDSKHRTPVDLLSGPVVHATGTGSDSVATEVFSWGSGTNYQLGTGNAHIQKLPCKVDALQGCDTKIIAAAKFHSIAVGAGGELYTWGFGRGGRLGHPDFDIHSGQAAVITPRQVTVGLGSRRVKDVAVAKHHTVIATENGDVFTWGSNREGQLGYTSVDTQATPRRISSLRSKIICVAAANKHSAAVSESGEVFTWGCNKGGQLGYGTSNSASNYTPRVVEYLKGKVFTAISAAKRHTIVLSNDGEVFTWGHRLVTPKRVVIARNLRKSGHSSIKFHRMEKLRVVSVTAGMMHSTALTDDGALFYWVSSDPNLRCQQLYSMCGKNIVSISSGKYWTAAVSDSGDVYRWDGKKQRDEAPIPTRLHGVKRATSVAVGETHLLVISALYHPSNPLKAEVRLNKSVSGGHELDELDQDFIFNDVEPSNESVNTDGSGLGDSRLPSLKSLCEKTVIECLVEPRNAIQLLEIADSLEADKLRIYCEEIAIRNLDFIFTVSVPVIASASLDILAKLEKSLDMKSSEPWSHRQLPTPTATFPAVIDVEDDGLDDKGYLRLRDNSVEPMLNSRGGSRTDTFFHTDSGSESAELLVSKQVRALKKKLQQIEMLEAKLSDGCPLDEQQLMKLQTKFTVLNALAELGLPLERLSSLSYPVASDAKTNHSEASRKQRKKKQKENYSGTMLSENEFCGEKDPGDALSVTNGLQILHLKEDAEISRDDKSGATDDTVIHSPRGTPQKSSDSDRTSKGTSSKKKNRKGGLSMFLSGALDDKPRDILPPPPPTPKIEGPAWGGVKVSKESASLRDIQNEQSRTRKIQPIHIQKVSSDNLVESQISTHVPFGNILSGLATSPIAAGRAQASPASLGEKSTPPWSSGGTPPKLCKASLRDIQMQQGRKNNLSHSPKTRTTGFSITPTQVTASESSSRPKDAIPNRWFKPEVEAPSSIRSIQIEEKAMQQLKRLYSNVRLVKPQAHAPS